MLNPFYFCFHGLQFNQYRRLQSSAAIYAHFQVASNVPPREPRELPDKVQGAINQATERVTRKSGPETPTARTSTGNPEKLIFEGVEQPEPSPRTFRF